MKNYKKIAELTNISYIKPFRYCNTIWACYKSNNCYCLLSKLTGAPVYTPHIWFSKLEELSEAYFIATREDNLKTIIRKFDLSIVFENKWFPKWKLLKDGIFEVNNKQGAASYLEINKKNNLCNLDFWFINKTQYKDNVYIFERVDGMKTFIDINNYSIIFHNLWFLNWESFNNLFDKMTRADGKKTLVNKFTNIFQYANAWFFEWVNFDKECWKVTAENNLKTLINKSDATERYPNKWFYDWKEFNSDTFLVTNENGDATLIDKEDGEFILPEKDRWNKEDDYYVLEKGAIIRTKEDNFFVVREDKNK